MWQVRTVQIFSSWITPLICASSSSQHSAWRHAGSWLQCSTYPLKALVHSFTLSHVFTLEPLVLCTLPLLKLNQSSTRGTTRARWASTSSRSCSQLWTAGSRTSWCSTRTGAERWSLMRWPRQLTAWVRRSSETCSSLWLIRPSGAPLLC